MLRGRLLDQIDRLSSAALTLVDAPVGFGKTMLVQSWSARTEAAVAWVSLDGGDDDPSRLWTYVATSIDRVRPGLGRPALARLRAVGSSPEAAVDELVNGVSSYEGSLAVVLDDLHVLGNERCLRSVQHAVEHLPSHARIIVTTRSDPGLPLGRLRASGALGEIRARELAFTLDEARELLVGREGIGLDDGDLALLVERTEGWPAGLYLAALWLRELDDPKAGVDAFHGDHRHVADYLTGEVLDTLDADTRGFLLETSVFGTFNGSMCDAILGRSDSARRLRALERANGFLMTLDARGEWYRYHHLFGELLQLELASVDPSAAARLHTAASQWYAGHGRVEDALEHAAAANDPRLLAAILADEHRVLLRSGRLDTILRWCAWLPDELLVERAELPLAAALAAGLASRPGDVRNRLLALAGRARSERPNEWTPYHEGGFGLARATWVESSVAETIELARSTVAAARDIPELAVATLAVLGHVLFLGGEHEEARARAQEALDRPEAPARPHGLVIALATLSLIDSGSDRPVEAEERARRAIAAARGASVDDTWSEGLARTALASALSPQGRLREAEREATRGERLRHRAEPEAGHLHALLVLAAIRARRGQLDLAARDLEKARSGLGAFTDAGRLPELAAAVENTLEKAQATAGALWETPSAAELNVLRLLATDLSQREIGARLFLSLNTVKTHTRALYRKLGVTSREEAVERAMSLGLLDTYGSPG